MAGFVLEISADGSCGGSDFEEAEHVEAEDEHEEKEDDDDEGVL